MRRKQEIKFVCNKCGKDMPYDTESKYNNENWKAIKTTCECGGKGTHILVDNPPTRR